MASLVPGHSLLMACAITWLAVWRSAERPSGSFAVKMLKWQSLSTTVLKSASSPSISATQAILARPSLMSFAMSRTDIGFSYSLTEPSFNVIFILILLFMPSVSFPRPLVSDRQIFRLWNKKSPLANPLRICQGTTFTSRFHPACMKISCHSFDDNGITVPD